VEKHGEEDFDRPDDSGNDKRGAPWRLHTDATGA